MTDKEWADQPLIDWAKRAGRAQQAINDLGAGAPDPNAYAAELEAECDQYQAKLTEVWAEVAALRAENERLARAFADSEAACLIQVRMLRADNERLVQHHADYHRICSMGGNTPCPHEAENERLRAEVETLRKVIKSAPAWRG